jgi:hypothetical protein
LVNTPLLAQPTATIPFYGTNLQAEDYATTPAYVSTYDLSLTPLYIDFNDLDDTFLGLKQLPYFLFSTGTSNTFTLSTGFGARSYSSVFHTFQNSLLDLT